METQYSQLELLQNLNTAVVVHAPDTRIIYSNTRATKILGLSEEQLQGKTAIDPAWHFINDQGGVLPLNGYPVNLVISSRQRIDGIVLGIIIPQQTEPTWVSVDGVPEFDLNGELSQVVVSFYDITELKKTEERLSKSEELLRLSSELANVAAWEMDLATDSITRSSNHDQLYGLTDLGQWDINTFIDATHVDDREKYDSLINRSLAPGGPDQYKFDFRILYPDKSIHWLNVIGRVIARDSEGVGIKLRGFVTDITEQKHAVLAVQRSQKLLAETEKIGKVGGWEFYIDTGKQTWTEEVYRIHELDHGAEPSVATGINFYTPESRPIIEQAVRRAVEHGESFDLELEIITAKGNRRNVHTIGKADLEHRRIYGFFQDITARRKAEKALVHSERKFRTFVAASSDALYRMNSDWTEMINVDGQGFVADTPEPSKAWFQEYVPVTEQSRVMTVINEAIRTKNTFELEHRVRRADGTIGWTFSRAIPLFDAKGEIEEWFGAASDVTARKEAEVQMRIAATAFEAQQGMMVTDANNVIISVNKAFIEITGYSRDESVGQKPELIKSGRHDASFYNAIWSTIEATGSWQGEIWSRRKNGEEYPKFLTITAVKNDDDKASHYVSVFYDISTRKAHEKKIEDLAFYDPLTGLANRRLLLDRLQQTITTNVRRGIQAALLFLDLDEFKNLNDTAGHSAGDELLVQVAKRLEACVREGDTVARLGGDEFVVLLQDLHAVTEEAAAQAATVSEKILGSLAKPYRLVDFEHLSTTSIGITLVSHNGEQDLDHCLQQADLAMYQAKVAGKNTMRFFEPQMQATMKARVSLQSDLQLGVAKQQFALHYQAQVVEDNRIVGVEALVRWHHPDRGMVAPIDFITLAEETGLIIPLGRWVLETACAQLALWAQVPQMAEWTIAVNVSARQFQQADWVNQVLDILKQTGANPYRLKLELTESMLARNIQDTISKMTLLKAHGIGFALDDFGTGYSSLSYLKLLPIDQLKIDRSFVRDIMVDPNDAAIAQMLIVLAKTLELGVIAEGVETEAQRDALANLGCHAYQGYLFSKPLPLDEFEAFVKKA